MSEAPVEKPVPFHEQLKYERERRGWSQADVAEKVGCDTKTVGPWESGESLPRPYHRQALCKLFGKSAEEFGLMQARTGYASTSSASSDMMNGHTSSSFPPSDAAEPSPLPTPATIPAERSTIVEAQANETGSPLLREDWGEAPQAVKLYGRDKECSELAEWIDDHTIRVWDSDMGHCLHTLQDHTDRVRAVAFSSNGKFLASGSTDQTIRLWDIDTGNCLYTLRGHSGWIRSIAFASNGTLLASGSDDQTVQLWDVSSDQPLRTLHGHSSRVWSVAFNPDGQIVASSSEDRTIRLWDINTGQCLKMLQGIVSSLPSKCPPYTVLRQHPSSPEPAQRSNFMSCT